MTLLISSVMKIISRWMFIIPPSFPFPRGNACWMTFLKTAGVLDHRPLAWTDASTAKSKTKGFMAEEKLLSNIIDLQ
jgi:hypothetical protein